MGEWRKSPRIEQALLPERALIRRGLGLGPIYSDIWRGIHRMVTMARGGDVHPGCGCFRRKKLDHRDVTEEGMGFSQEIKAEAYLKGFRRGEARIGYKVRGRKVIARGTRRGRKQYGAHVGAHAHPSAPGPSHRGSNVEYAR